MKAVKSLVAFMGVLLVAGLALLGYGMYTKAGRAVKPSAEASVAPSSGPSVPVAMPIPSSFAAPATAYGAQPLGQPAGSRIAAVTLNNGLAAVTITGGGLGDRLVILDTTAGRQIGQFTIDAGKTEAAKDTGKAGQK